MENSQQLFDQLLASDSLINDEQASTNPVHIAMGLHLFTIKLANVVGSEQQRLASANGNWNEVVFSNDQEKFFARMQIVANKYRNLVGKSSIPLVHLTPRMLLPYEIGNTNYSAEIDDIVSPLSGGMGSKKSKNKKKKKKNASPSAETSSTETKSEESGIEDTHSDHSSSAVVESSLGDQISALNSAIDESHPLSNNTVVVSAISTIPSSPTNQPQALNAQEVPSSSAQNVMPVGTLVDTAGSTKSSGATYMSKLLNNHIPLSPPNSPHKQLIREVKTGSQLNLVSTLQFNNEMMQLLDEGGSSLSSTGTTEDLFPILPQTPQPLKVGNSTNSNTKTSSTSGSKSRRNESKLSSYVPGLESVTVNHTHTVGNPQSNNSSTSEERKIDSDVDSTTVFAGTPAFQTSVSPGKSSAPDHPAAVPFNMGKNCSISKELLSLVLAKCHSSSSSSSSCGSGGASGGVGSDSGNTTTSAVETGQTKKQQPGALKSTLSQQSNSVTERDIELLCSAYEEELVLVREQKETAVQSLNLRLFIAQNEIETLKERIEELTNKK